MDKDIQTIFADLSKRRLPEGGFAEKLGGEYRPDATAWAVMALESIDKKHEFIDPACDSLADYQLMDGRIPVYPEYPQACWPTPLAAMAWQKPAYVQAREYAISFLLNFTGSHGGSLANSPLGHDTALRGWPWVADTHSWVEPTALSITALQSAGYRKHQRVEEAIKMLMDRQLPEGGWNYGNTKVYGHQLRPMPDSTGLALLALAGSVSRKDVSRSLEYLSTAVPEIKTPFSLSWGLLGLNAWQIPEKTAGDLIAQCLFRRALYGGVTTTHLCLLLLAHPETAEYSILQKQGRLA